MESKNDSNKCDLKDHLNSPPSQADHRAQSCISHYKSHSVYFYIWQLFFFFLHRIVFFPCSVLYEFFCINSKILWPIPPLSCHISCHFFVIWSFCDESCLNLKKKNLLNIFSGGFFFFFFPIGINVPELLKHIQSGFLVAYSSHSRSITSSGLIFWLISQLKKSSITKEGTFQF